VRRCVPTRWPGSGACAEPAEATRRTVTRWRRRAWAHRARRSRLT
jgi:hypothetical protein